jgi:hypothetical protein
VSRPVDLARRTGVSTTTACGGDASSPNARVEGCCPPGASLPEFSPYGGVSCSRSLVVQQPSPPPTRLLGSRPSEPRRISASRRSRSSVVPGRRARRGQRLVREERRGTGRAGSLGEGEGSTLVDPDHQIATPGGALSSTVHHSPGPTASWSLALRGSSGRSPLTPCRGRAPDRGRSSRHRRSPCVPLGRRVHHLGVLHRRGAGLVGICRSNDRHDHQRRPAPRHRREAYRSSSVGCRPMVEPGGCRWVAYARRGASHGDRCP